MTRATSGSSVSSQTELSMSMSRAMRLRTFVSTMAIKESIMFLKQNSLVDFSQFHANPPSP
jgi:hypothetical protein